VERRGGWIGTVVEGHPLLGEEGAQALGVGAVLHEPACGEDVEGMGHPSGEGSDPDRKPPAPEVPPRATRSPVGGGSGSQPAARVGQGASGHGR